MPTELITLVDLLQPQCTRTYGSAPCTAAIGTTGALKCHNTRFTCQDPANYVAENITLRFSLAQEGGYVSYGYVLPAIEGMKITPLTLNLGGMDSGMSPFGRRESVQIQFKDFLHSDQLVDKYRLERPTGAAGTVYDPYTSGTFWSKWLARNPYHEGLIIIVRQGTTEQAIDDMEPRYYTVDRISPANDGAATLVAKDIFSLAEARKSVAPRASRGELRTGFDDKHTGTIQLVPEGIIATDYPTGEFWVAINDECLKVSRADGSDLLQILERAALGTVVEEHDGSDKVQLVLHYDSEQAQDIVYDLLTNYTIVGPEYIDLPEWNAEMFDRPERLSAFIAEPTPVETLIGELAEQVGFSIWPSVTTNRVKIKVLRPQETITPTVDDDYWMIEGSYASKPLNNQRVSQCWVYYGQRNPLAAQDDPVNYRSRRIFADLEAESSDLYGTPAIRTVFSRWIPQYAGTFATTAGNRILSMFRDPPRRVSFSLYRTRESELNIAELFLLESRDDTDEIGEQITRTLAPIEMIREDERILVQAQEVSFFSEAADERLILIEEDDFCVNLANIYTLLYGTAVAGEVVVFRILPGVTIGSDTYEVPALDTGDWPSGVDLRLEIETGARIAGRGGNGGATDGSNGEDGGTGIFVRANLVIENNGSIAAGGGGGGGAREEYSPYGAAAGEGGGGAGIEPGDGYEDGTDTDGGGGSTGITSLPYDPFGPEAILFAAGGEGGDRGEPGQPGTVGGLGASSTAGEGGAAGLAIDGGGYVFFDPEGTIVGEISDSINTTFDPAPMAPTDLELSGEVTPTSAADYSTTMVFTFTIPDDDRIISFEAQLQTSRAPGTWRPLYDSLLNRYEWGTAELGWFRVRVRSVYVRGLIYSGWVSDQYFNTGPFEQIAEIGIDEPIEPRLFMTTNRDKSTAKIRVTAGYDPFATVTPDRLLIFYSVADQPNRLIITADEGDKLRIEEASGVVGTFTMPVVAGSTTAKVNYSNVGNLFDIDLVGYWWAQVDDGVTPPGPYLKIDEADEVALYLAPGDAFPFTPSAGNTINVIESNFSDSRIAEFRFLYRLDPSNPDSRGEVVTHNGIRRDGPGDYYIDVEARAQEGTTEQDWTGLEAHYFPAPGPLTSIIEIPAGNFGGVSGEINFSGDVALLLPNNIVWASISCCLARRTANGSRTRYVRSNIVPLPIAGPA